ncbi:GtrA family protein [Sphingobium sp.]|uniref:GtrA family protein n=1 Tax=Sphingobium sp. TaxID=1912891 RepID=UPI002B628B54|nr:GtrA family protein [Sphingobium sp.]HUD91925.1 GtrA family protein [Sphingobium sp.]
MPLPVSRARLIELWRYYQMGVLNTAFGLGAYALLVWLGLNMFVAQLVAHLMGMAFNYVSYSRHVFRGAAPAKLRFILSYGVNYLLGLGALAAISRVIESPYMAGFLAAFLVSIVNYFALKYLVFRTKAA